MPMPRDGDVLTADQVTSSLNASDFPEFEIDKNWHTGLFEPWSMEFGYPDGMPIYGGIKAAGVSYHIYYLNDGHQLPIILARGQTPQSWGIDPEKTELDGRREVTLRLPLSPDYEDEHVVIAGQDIDMVLDLRGGPRGFQSSPAAVGSYQCNQIVASLAFDYEYDPIANELTIRGNDDRTGGQLTITTALAGVPHPQSDQLPALAFAHQRNDVGANLPARDLWADHVVAHPGMVSAFAATAHAGNEAIVRQAIDAGIDSVVELGTPPIVTLDNLDGYKMMFGEPVTELAAEDRIAEVVRIQFKVDSTYVGTVTWTLDYAFANVIGSTHDPKVPGFPSWIGLWEVKCNGSAGPSTCSSFNYFSADPNKHCSGPFVGGHVVAGTSTESPPQGATVYIFPICQTHNTNNGGYMKMKYNPKGVKLSYW